jgi:hypothetical protein
MRLRELQGYRNDPGYQQLLKTKQIDMDDIDAYPDAEGISDSFNDFIEIAKKNGWHQGTRILWVRAAQARFQVRL